MLLYDLTSTYLGVRRRRDVCDIYRRGMVMLRRAFKESQRKNGEMLTVFHNPRMPIGEQPRPNSSSILTPVLTVRAPEKRLFIAGSFKAGK